MNRLASFIILCSLLVLSACQADIDTVDGGKEKILLVNLDVSVALSDVSAARTRAAEDYYDPDGGAANDNEKMHTLRIVIVRPNGTVEANRLIDLGSAVSLKHEWEEFRVVGNETKRIYLFVNEGAKAKAVDGTGIARKLVDFDLNGIREKERFPQGDIEGLQIRLEENSERIDGPLPMSECHEHFVTEEEEQSCELFVTRAAVKFTFVLKNELQSRSVTFESLMIDKMATKEWFLPRATYGERLSNGVREITDYEVPADAGYYTYGKNTSVTGGITVEPGKAEVLPSIYLLEGKYTEDPDEDGQNYSVNITLNRMTGKYYFKNPYSKTLPRNTHVVVYIIYKDYAKVECEVDVIPYSEVLLDPDFGL